MRQSIISIAILLLAGQAQASVTLTTARYFDIRSGITLTDAGSFELQPGGNISLLAGNLQLASNQSISSPPLAIANPGEITIFSGQPILASQGQISISPPTILNIQSSVPEPESWAMLLTGLGLLGVRCRKRN